MSTSRLEAFSDGVFAIAITLLVLNLHVPQPGEITQRSLVAVLLDQWPLYVAYVTSFLTILIIWINHHHIFSLIGQADRLMLFLNGLLLLVAAIIPFPTALVSENLPSHAEQVAAALYAGTFLLVALLFNGLWRYAATGDRLLRHDADADAVARVSQQYRFGPSLYLLALLLAIVNAWASVLLCMALAVFFGLPLPTRRREA